MTFGLSQIRLKQDINYSFYMLSVIFSIYTSTDITNFGNLYRKAVTGVSFTTLQLIFSFQAECTFDMFVRIIRTPSTPADSYLWISSSLVITFCVSSNYVICNKQSKLEENGYLNKTFMFCMSKKTFQSFIRLQQKRLPFTSWAKKCYDTNPSSLNVPRCS